MVQATAGAWCHAHLCARPGRRDRPLQAPESGPWTDFTAPNSLREVETGSNLLLREDDPSDDPTAGFPDPPVGEDDDEGVAVAAEDADAEDADVVVEESDG